MVMHNNSSLLSPRKIAGLLLTQAFIIIPLLAHLPLWICGLWMAVALWRWQILRNQWFAPPSYLITFITISCATGLYINFAGQAGTDAALALLICTFILKMLEMRNLRDAQLVVFIGFIATATQLLLSQTLAAGLYALICCGILLSSWRGIYLYRHQPLKKSFKHNVTIYWQAIPIMLVLFILLPRIGPLWTMPDDQVPKSGFTDHLSAGDLGQLVKNHDTAFRVSFNEKKPDNKDLYWRGLVLNQFDGNTWTQDSSNTIKSTTRQSTIASSNDTEEDLIGYSIMLEAHGYPWLFTLGKPISVDSDAMPLRINQQGLISSHDIIRQRLSYQVKSTINARIEQNLSDADKKNLLTLPKNTNPQTQKMVAQWKADGLSTDDIIAQMQYKIAREFRYTLQPPPLGKQAIDDFLFNTKQGFCEHFASSFATVMRSAGVPARVVLGYQGGTWNDIEHYLLVSQADAHAWVEIWTDNHWQRIDPTTFIAPERIESGIDDALPEKDRPLLSRRWQQSPWLWQLQQRWDAAGYVWYKFVINYNADNQQRLIDTILGDNPLRLVLVLTGLILTLAALFTSIFWIGHRKVFSAEYEKLVYLLEKKLKKRGYTIENGESLSAFCRRVSQTESALNSQLIHISQEIENSLYRNTKIELHQLKKLIGKL